MQIATAFWQSDHIERKFFETAPLHTLTGHRDKAATLSFFLVFAHTRGPLKKRSKEDQARSSRKSRQLSGSLIAWNGRLLGSALAHRESPALETRWSREKGKQRRLPFSFFWFSHTRTFKKKKYRRPRVALTQIAREIWLTDRTGRKCFGTALAHTESPALETRWPGDKVALSFS